MTQPNIHDMDNSIDVPLGYKQTEVGVIPEEWETAKLGNLIDYTKGYAFKPSEYASDGIRIIRVSDTTYDSTVEVNPVFVAASKAVLYAKWALKENDLVISTVGSKPPMYDSMVGKVILIQQSYKGALLNQNAVLIRDKKRRAHFQHILLGHFRTKRYLVFIESIYRGNANQASVTLKELFQFWVPLPSLDAEQRAIAEVLSDVDRMLGALEALIEKKRAIKQAAMQQLLTGRTRLPGFSADWKTKCLGNVAEIKSGATPSTQVTRYWNGSIPWCTPTDITGTSGKYLTRTERHISGEGLASCGANLLPAGTVLLCSRATIGEVKIAQTEVCTNQGFKSFVCRDSVSNEFLYYLLLTLRPQMIKRAIGSTFIEIGKRDVESIVAEFPDKGEQTAIATVLSDMDAEIAALEARRDKTRAIKQGMMQQLLTGRIRLVKPQPAETNA